jgi:hypothetical protein
MMPPWAPQSRKHRQYVRSRTPEIEINQHGLNDVCYPTPNGLKPDICSGPKSARQQTHALQQAALDFGFALAAMAAGSVQ